MEFSTREVCDITGTTYRQLDEWARLEAFTPSVTAAIGAGSRRRYSLHDVVVASIMLDLAALGYDADKKRTVTDTIRRWYPTVDELPDELIVTLDGRVVPAVAYTSTCVVVRPTAHRGRVLARLPVRVA